MMLTIDYLGNGSQFWGFGAGIASTGGQRPLAERRGIFLWGALGRCGDEICDFPKNNWGYGMICMTQQSWGYQQELMIWMGCATLLYHASFMSPCDGSGLFYLVKAWPLLVHKLMAMDYVYVRWVNNVEGGKEGTVRCLAEFHPNLCSWSLQWWVAMSMGYIIQRSHCRTKKTFFKNCDEPVKLGFDITVVNDKHRRPGKRTWPVDLVMFRIWNHPNSSNLSVFN